MSPAPSTRPGLPGWARQTGQSALVVLVLAVLWELVKAVVPDGGVVVGGMSLLPRTTDQAMPHVWDVVSRLAAPETSATDSVPLATALVTASWFTLRISLAGWLVGVLLGLGLAVLMQRWRLVEDALAPWIVLSQTVPLIALAPLVVGWGGKISIGAFAWDRWMSVALIASYLAFFPVAVGALRGLQSPTTAQVDLFRALAASDSRTLWRLRLPAAVPYLLPALRLGAATAVVGAIVAEVSTGTQGGIGRLIISYAQSATGDPAKPWAAIAAAAVLGLVAAAVVGLVGLGLNRFRVGEVTA